MSSPPDQQSFIKWTTVPNVVQTIAQDSFGGWEHALLEAIKNAVDAQATRIDITVPSREIMVEDPDQKVVIEDNGRGMSRAELEGNYCAFGIFKDKHRGTGKIATLKVARRASVETWTVGKLLKIEFDTGPVLETRGTDFPEQPVAVGDAPTGASGTRLTLMGFKQDESPPSVSVAHHVLLRNLHRWPGVRFFVNGQEFRAEDHATEVLAVEDELIEGVGTGSLRVLLVKPRERLSKPGIMICAGGQTVHGPDMFGLDNKGYRGDADAASRRLIGRLDLTPTDGGPIASGSWTITGQYGAVREWAGRHLESVVDRETAGVVDDRVEKLLNDPSTRRSFDKLPDNEKAVARRILKEQAKKTGTPNLTALTVISRLVCRSLQTDALGVVLDVLNDSSNEEVETFSELFKGQDRWTLRQVTRAASLVKHHLQAVRDLEDCVGDYTKNEWQIHEILRENPWLIADDFHSFRSNRQLKTTLKTLFKIDVDDREALRRPDFFFALGDAASSSMAQPGRYLFIELKGPDQPLAMEHQNQVVRDAKKFLRHQPGFAYCVLIGSQHDPKEPPDPETESKGLYTFKALTYRDVIERARFRLDYIADGVKESGAEEFARQVRDIEVEMMVQTGGGPKRSKKNNPEPPPAPAGPRRISGDTVEKWINCVPLLDLKVAAGQFGSTQVIEEEPEDSEWVALDGKVQPSKDLFVARVEGESMNRRIPNGAWCLWRARPTGPFSGKVVLVQHRDIEDPQTGGKYAVKLYDAEEIARGDGSMEIAKVILRPDSSDPSFKPIVLDRLLEGELFVVAEMVEVLG